MARGKVASGKTDAENMFDEFEDLDFDQTYAGGLDTAAVVEAEQDETSADDDGDEEPAGREAEEVLAKEDDNGAGRLGGYRVHPAAAIFPLIEGREFDELVESLRAHGQSSPIIVHEGVLLDGRNRLRAIERLQAQRVVIEPWIKEWDPTGWDSEVDFITAANLHRRHLTDAQRAQIAAELVPMLAQGRAEAQEASRIKPGEVRNSGGVNQHSKSRKADAKTQSPADKQARHKEKAARSTVGKIADTAKVTAYAASQAVKIKNEAPPEMVEDVKAGRKKQKDVIAELNAAKGKKPKKTKAAKPIDHPFKPSNEFERAVLQCWIRLVESEVGVAEKARGRRVMREIFKAEEEAEKQAAAAKDGGK
jgi:hypothetical protein